MIVSLTKVKVEKDRSINKKLYTYFHAPFYDIKSTKASANNIYVPSNVTINMQIYSMH